MKRKYARIIMMLKSKKEKMSIEKGFEDRRGERDENDKEGTYKP